MIEGLELTAFKAEQTTGLARFADILIGLVLRSNRIWVVPSYGAKEFFFYTTTARRGEVLFRCGL